MGIRIHTAPQNDLPVAPRDEPMPLAPRLIERAPVRETRRHGRWDGVRRTPDTDYLRTAEWRRLRKIALDRDGHACVVCGRTDCRLEVDHIIPVRAGGTNDISNLQTMCRRHHWQKTVADKKRYGLTGGKKRSTIKTKRRAKP